MKKVLLVFLMVLSVFLIGCESNDVLENTSNVSDVEIEFYSDFPITFSTALFGDELPDDLDYRRVAIIGAEKIFQLFGIDFRDKHVEIRFLSSESIFNMTHWTDNSMPIWEISVWSQKTYLDYLYKLENHLELNFNYLSQYYLFMSVEKEEILFANNSGFLNYYSAKHMDGTIDILEYMSYVANYFPPCELLAQILTQYIYDIMFTLHSNDEFKIIFNPINYPFGQGLQRRFVVKDASSNLISIGFAYNSHSLNLVDFVSTERYKEVLSNALYGGQ